ncbi:MAG TPA: hypothetical protein VFB91_06090 [Terriglobales bacterium]|nr:hypothetical protein [Terriglobales bacterium]
MSRRPFAGGASPAGDDPLEEFEKLRIEFAYPTQTLYLTKT